MSVPEARFCEGREEFVRIELFAVGTSVRLMFFLRNYVLNEFCYCIVSMLFRVLFLIAAKNSI